jgi:hypothetical protein
MEERAITKEIKKAKTSVHDITHTDSELYKVGMYTAAAFTAAAGIWGLICLSSAIFENGSPLEIVKNLFQAITGA